MFPTENPTQIRKIRELLSGSEYFSSLDYHFGIFIGRLARENGLEAALAGALVSRARGEGNICLDLENYAGKPLPDLSPPENKTHYVCPSLSDWTGQLIESGVVSHAGENTPLVLIGSRLYLRRFREYENHIVRFIIRQAESVPDDLDETKLQKDLKKFFNFHPGQEPDWQQVAAIAALSRSFCVISGGPGTGKTTTVAKILALLLHQYKEKKQPRIYLAAPTGKAASRLQQAIIETGLFTPDSEIIQASTLHRLLGHIPDSPYFRHNAERQLDADVVVIDEASMVDMPLMAKLVQAVPSGARLILLGDRHQLASVQPGSVFGDICSTKIMSSFSGDFKQRVTKLTGTSIADKEPLNISETFSALQDSFVELEHNYRFGTDSSIARLAEAINEGDGDNALEILLASDDGAVSWHDIPDPSELGRVLHDSPLMEQIRAMQQARDPVTCFSMLDDFRLLCGLRQGPYGTARINHLLERMFSQQLPAAVADRNPGLKTDRINSSGIRPIMVNRNDYNLRLYNGDVGIIMPDSQNPQSLRAYFRTEQGTLRDIALPLLPGHETVFAMTVHKSQGSEFNNLLIILPDRNSPVLTRELLYTAITRARKKVVIWGRKEIFAAAVKRRIKRTSGLAEELSIADS